MDTGMQAVFLDFATLGEDITADPLAKAADGFTLFPMTATEQLIERCEHADAVFTNKCRFDRETLEALPKLRYIGLTATGADGIDLVAAGERRVAVTNITSYCTQSVVQHVFATLLSLTHRLRDYQQRIDDGAWQQPGSFCLLDFPIRELSGLTLGIVGYGELGRAVASVAEAFGMRVLIARRDEHDKRPGRVPLSELLAVADVVSLHCPLNAATHHLIDAEALSQMKRDAILINTARGGLIDAVALADALREQRIGGAAIDVLEQEPPINGNALLERSLHNLMVTPHIAWAAREARQRAIDQTAENFLCFRRGRTRNRIEIEKN